MRKIIGLIMSAIIIMMSCGSLVACGCNYGSDKGTYYKYDDGSYNKSSYITLDGSKWEDDAGYSGTYTIQDGKITFYMTLYGYTEEFADGTIKDGVIIIEMIGMKYTYCKEGCKPSTGNTNEETQHTHNYIETVVEPTCAKSGYTLRKCSICGDEIKIDTVPATGAHNYVNGVCSVCGEAQQMTDGSYFKFTLLADDTFEIRVNNTNDLPAAVVIAPSYYGTKVTRIREEAFQNCTKLTSIEIPSGVTSIGESAFNGCNNLTKITIPDSVKSIGSSAFNGCRSLTNIVIPNGVKSIGEKAFYGCSSLTSIVIPNSVTGIGASTFTNCDNLQYNEYDNGLYLGDNTNLYVAIVGTRSVDIANCVIHKNTKIISGAFAKCKNIRSISIPNGVTSIGDRAFSGCTGLTSVTIPNSVTSIGGYAFSGCTGLTSVTIPNSVISIGGYAFNGCTGLTSVTIPNSVTSIGGYAFVGCKSLENITIPNSVTSIENYVFAVCDSLTSVTIPNGVTRIGDYAFGDCKNLVTVTIPNSVTSIGSEVFYQSRNFRQIIFTGTKQEWKSISKSTKWNTTNYERTYVRNVPISSLTIHCIDGDVAV